MRDIKTAEVNGKPCTIPKLDAASAFDVACIVAEWRGKLLAAAGDEGLKAEAAGLDSIQAAGRMLTQAAKMLRDREYRELVWVRVLHGCTLNGEPVMGADGKSPRDSHDLADLYKLHMMSIDHSCGSFLQALGAGQAQGAKAT